MKLAKLRDAITLAPPRDDSADSDHWTLTLLRIGGVLVVLSQLSAAIPDLLVHRATAHIAAPLYALNILTGLLFVFATTTEWMARRWRLVTLLACIGLMASTSAISILDADIEFVFITILLLDLAGGAFLPWSTEWEDVLSAAAIATFAILSAIRWVRDSNSVLHWVGICTAVATAHFASLVNERRRAYLNEHQDRLEESEATLLKAIDSILDPLAINDVATGRYIKVNEEFMRLTGLKREEIVGRAWTDIDFRPQTPLEAESMERLLREGNVRNVEATIALPGARTMDCLISSVLVDLGGRRCALSVARDVTELKATHRKLEAASEAALAASRAKSEFLSSMSHEIRTPMNAILGMSDLLAETQLTPEQSKFVQTMTSNGNALLALINGILDLAKVESGRMHLEQSEFDLEELVDQVAETLSVRARERGIELATRIMAEVPRRLVGDPLRLRQVLVNLVGNAIKFTEHGEVVVTVQIDPQGGQTKRTGAEAGAAGDLRFSVRDTGIGISSDRIEAIFQSFTQADSSTTRKYGGSGLGLAIARRLVELMEGRIWVESQPGNGSTFYFTVRLSIAEHRGHAESLPRFGGVRVLIADENASTRLIVREMLQNRGAQTVEVERAEQALVELEAASKGGNPFSILIVDRKTWESNSGEATKRVRDDLAYRALRILILTSDEVNGAKRDDEAASVIAVHKPIRRSELFGAIMRALAAKPQTSDGSAARTDAPCDTGERPLTILLAEDSRDNRTLVNAYLKGLPYEIDVAENGAIAVQKFQRRRYDLVLMDMQMPVLDGYNAVREIREWESAEARTPTPIVALTASALPEEIRQSTDAGCTMHISKPVKKSRLLSAIRTLTGGEDAAQADARETDNAARSQESEPSSPRF